MSDSWQDLRLQQLLDVRLCDLRLKLAGSWVEPRVNTVLQELARLGLRFRPHFWFSDEWFSPVGVPGVAIPFYLAHPKLIRLERQQMLEAEGGTATDCKRLLRHEIGHAVQHGYALHRRPRWQELFGLASEPYPDHYAPDPNTRDYVHHLDSWYAQSHPSEDFAETFAVWASPRSNWRKQYDKWPALEKLTYVDKVMKEVSDRPPPHRGRSRPGGLEGMRIRLRTHYQRRRERYQVGDPTSYDRDLLRLFTPSVTAVGQSAPSFLLQFRREIRESVAKWTGENLFAVDQVLNEFIIRCRELKLRAVGSPRTLQMDVALLVSVHTMTLLHLRRQTWVQV